MNEKHIEEKLGHKNLPAITNKYDLAHKKRIYELLDEPNKHPKRRFLPDDFALKVIMDCRTEESCNFKRNLRFNLHDVINNKEQTVSKSIKEVFEGEDMQTQYSVLSYRVDLYFHDYNLAVEIDEFGHSDRDIGYEIEIQKTIEKELGRKFIMINPDEENF